MIRKIIKNIYFLENTAVNQILKDRTRKINCKFEGVENTISKVISSKTKTSNFKIITNT